MTNRLVELRERVRRAEDRLPDGDLAMLLCGLNGENVKRFDIVCGDDGSPEFAVRGTGGFQFNVYRRSCPDVSIDSALALVERVLPGFEWDRDANGRLAIYWRTDINSDWITGEHRPNAASVPLAILDALLSALIEQEPHHG